MSSSTVKPPPPPPEPPAVAPIRCIIKKPIVYLSVDDEIVEACERAGFRRPKEDCKVIYRPVKPIIQSGPTCGPVALAMMFNQSAKEITKIAIEEKFSNNGEIFSCADMETLTRMIAKLADADVQISRKVDYLCCSETVKDLIDGAVMIVPYDADFNHSPCLRKGHRAHWALIVGVINVPNDTPVVLARQGKSALLQAWDLERLAASNCNLVTFSPERESDDLSYVIPPGGLAGDLGLSKQYITVKFYN